MKKTKASEKDIRKQEELIAVIAAVIGEDLGVRVSDLTITSIKKIKK